MRFQHTASTGRGLLRAGTLLAAVALVAAGCSKPQSSGQSTGGSADRSIPEGGMIGQQAEVKPVQGGTLNIGENYPVGTLDPVASIAHGCCGGNELSAIYDTLVRFDPKTRTFEPQLAASLEGNSGATEFTLKLRPGTTFSDGTPLDSAAVVFSLKRFIELKSRFAPLVANIASYDTPDAQTVVFTLKSAWPQFPSVLTDAPGMIVSPAAVKQLGNEKFAQTPVGAGAFKVKSFVPSTRLDLVANAGYVNGRPPLDGLVFKYLEGDTPKVDAMKSGQLQATFLRDAIALDAARKAGFPGYVNLQGLGRQLTLNNGVGEKKRPTSDKRVRQAIAMAINPKVINERANEGTGFPTKNLLAPGSAYLGKHSTLDYDKDKAKALVKAAKKDLGWDGSLNLVCDTSPSIKAAAVAMSGMLDAVGFKTDLELVGDTSVLTQRTNVQGDFDAACGGFNLDGHFPYIALKLRFASDSVQNTTGYRNPELDSLLTELQAADTKDQITSVMDKVQDLFSEDAPVVPVGAWPESMVWLPEVHGIKPTGYSVVLFDKAFLAKK